MIYNDYYDVCMKYAMYVSMCVHKCVYMFVK